MKPYYEDSAVTIFHGDCREVLAETLYWPEDLPNAVVTDPPYGDTALDWDVPVDGWLALISVSQVWCFGSMRAWLRAGREFEAQGYRYGQEVIWEKHNGSGFNADRFKRVHEIAMHWYRGDWSGIYARPPMTFDATARTVRRRGRTPHRGEIGAKVDYRTEDGGPRLQRSVIYVRSENGRALHPTQKPLGILAPLIEYSVPRDGEVLDPFAGSGSTLVAAKQAGRRAVGIEIEERFCEIAAKRCAQEVLDLEAA